MTKKDTNELWRLLGNYRKGDKRLQDKELLEAWHLVMEPYTLEDAKEAMAAFFREKPYWPEPSEVALRCIHQPKQRRGADKPTVQVPKSIEQVYKQIDEMLAVGSMMERDYISAGVPHPAEAKKRGWTAGQWLQRCTEAGL